MFHPWYAAWAFIFIAAPIAIGGALAGVQRPRVAALFLAASVILGIAGLFPEQSLLPVLGNADRLFQSFGQ